MDGEEEGIDGVAVWDGMGVYVQTHNGPHSPTHTDVCVTTKIQLEILRGSWATLFQRTASSFLGRSIHTHTHTHHSCVVVPTYTTVLGRYSQSTFRRHNHIHSPQAKSVTAFKSDHYTCNTCISWLTAALIWKGGNRQCMVHTATTVHCKELQATTETSQ